MMRALERLDLAQHLVGHGDGVGAGALGDGEGDGGFVGRLAPAAAASPGRGTRIGGLLAAVGDGGDVAQIDRRPPNTPTTIADFFGRLSRKAPVSMSTSRLPVVSRRRGTGGWPAAASARCRPG
jgi:hypothetical protein